MCPSPTQKSIIYRYLSELDPGRVSHLYYECCVVRGTYSYRDQKKVVWSKNGEKLVAGEPWKQLGENGGDDIEATLTLTPKNPSRFL